MLPECGMEVHPGGRRPRVGGGRAGRRAGRRDADAGEAGPLACLARL